MLDEDNPYRVPMSEEQITRLSLATIMGCMVKAMSESDPELTQRFSKILKSTYDHWRDSGAYPHEVLQPLSYANHAAMGD